MADKRITDLPELIQADSGDFIPIVDSSMNVTKRVAAEKVMPNGSVVAPLIPDGGVAPSKRSGGFKVGVIPLSMLTSTGNKTITGVGFKPKLVRFTVLVSDTTVASGSGIGAMDETGAQFYYYTSTTNTGSTARLSGTGGAIAYAPAGSTSRNFAFGYVSMNADGFTVNVTTSSGANFDIGYEAYA